MIGNYQLSIRKGGKVRQYIYPLGCELRCLVDAGAALLQGHCILIEPPDRMVPAVPEGSKGDVCD